jgi:hypothetical protein
MLFSPEVLMRHIVYLGKLQVQCSCGARVVPDPSLPVETILHECAECRILQGLPPEVQTPRRDTNGRGASLTRQGPVKVKDAQ